MTPSAVDEAAPAIPDRLSDLNGQSHKQTDGANGLVNQSSGSSMTPDATSLGPSSTSSCSLGDLQTEQKNAKTTKVDAVSTLDLCRKLELPRHPETVGC